jgi:hypothetical protein
MNQLSANTVTAGGVDLYTFSNNAFTKANTAFVQANSAYAAANTKLPRVVTIADATSITVNADLTDLAIQINTQVAGTLTINSTTGTPVNGQKIIIRVQCANTQTLSFNAIFAGSNDTVLPPTTTGFNKSDYMGFMYNTAASKWQLVAKNFGF